jgi:cytochrome c-type biogenesis protein CcmE
MTTTAPPPAPVAPPPPRKPKRSRYIAAVGGCLLAVVAVVVLTVVLSDNVVYYKTVSEAVSERKSQGTDRFRLAGAVVPGSIEETPNGVRFSVTDGEQTVSVVHRGDPPELFKKDAPVVCEGRWSAATAGAPFDSDRIMIKHGSDYAPPKVDTENAPRDEQAS